MDSNPRSSPNAPPHTHPVPPPPRLPEYPDDDGAGAFEQTLCQVRTVHVFKVPPRVTSGGHRAGDWKDEVWQGSLKVVQKGQDAAVLLVDPKTSALRGGGVCGLYIRVVFRMNDILTTAFTHTTDCVKSAWQTRSSPCAP